MCYSNSSTSTNIQLAERYKRIVPDNCPDQPIFCASGFAFPTWRVITKEPTIEVMTWGLIPNWFRGEDASTIASKTLNAKIESLEEKVSFRHLLKRNHCIIPSTGFFEWKHTDVHKIPYFISPNNESVFSMAGLQDHWIDSTGQVHHTFTIITCPANEVMREIHNTKERMPLLLLPEQEVAWLNGDLNEVEKIQTYPSSLISTTEINKAIISGKHSNVKEVQLPFKNNLSIQGRLF